MRVRRDTTQYIAHTNVSDDDQLICALSRRGYGSVRELNDLDTRELYDIAEYEMIMLDLEAYACGDRK